MNSSLRAELQASIRAIEQGSASKAVEAKSCEGNEAASSDEADKAYQKILRLVSHREHSTQSLAKRLRRAGFSQSAIDKAMQRAVSASIVDDVRYGDSLLRARLASGKGLNPVWRELEELSVDVERLDAYQEYLDRDDDESERAEAYLQRHPTRAKDLRAGAYRKLVSQGFSSAAAREAAVRWADAHKGAELVSSDP